MTTPSRWSVLAVMVVAGGLAGCGGGAAVPSPGPPSATTATSAGSVEPSASAVPTSASTESNPPGDIPDNQAYVAFAPPGAGVSVRVPEGWARAATGGVTVFTDKLNRIEIAPGQASAAPTVASVAAADVTKLRATVSKFTPGKVTADRRAGGPVVVVTYQGDSAPDPVTGKVVRDAFERYVYFRNGRRLDLTLSGPVNADNVDPWKIVSDSVRWQ